MRQPTISVIVPVYNVEKYLSECIESIINQTFTNLEIILINDGSTDLSGAICEDYAAKDSRIINIHQENQGLSAARNRGLDIARGEYILFVDSDDLISHECCEKLYRIAMEENADITQARAITISDERNSSIKKNDYVQNQHLYKESYTSLDAMEQLFNYFNSNIRVVSWNKLYRKDLFDSLRFPVNKIYEDEFLTPRLFYLANKIIVIGDITYFYRIRESSIMRSSFSIKQLDKLYIYRENLDFFKMINQESFYKKTLQVYTASIIRLYQSIYKVKDNSIYLNYLMQEFQQIQQEALTVCSLDLKTTILFKSFYFFPKLVVFLLR